MVACGFFDILVLFPITALMISCPVHVTTAFQPITNSQNLRYFLKDYSNKLNWSCSVLFAKAPPVSQFNLDEIEAFEAALEVKSRLVNNIEGTGISIDMMDGDTNDNDEDDDDEEEDDNDSTVSLIVPESLNNKRIDAVLAELEPSLSRSQCGSLVADGFVQIMDGDMATVVTRKSEKIASGTVLRFSVPKDEVPTEIIPENIPLNIVFEDEHMIVINKAAGMVVHPAAGNWDGTVVNALAYYLAQSPLGGGDFVDENGKVRTGNGDVSVDGTDGEAPTLRPGIVHRLDKGTTGILVVAKTTQALAALSAAFAARKVRKTYLAVTVGNPGKRVQINKPIGRHPVHRQKMRVVPDPHRNTSSRNAPKIKVDDRPPSQMGRRALSYVDTLAFDGRLSVVQVRIETGRTHQIRVHLQDRHTPVYGDDIYGLPDWNKQLYKTHQIDRPLLHAYKLELNHPITGESMTFKASLPEDMARISKTIWPQSKEERPDLFS